MIILLEEVFGLKAKDLQRHIFPLAKKLISQEYESSIKSQKIRKDIIEHRERMKERRKNFELIRNK
jgi:hypothetical protein